MTRWNGEKGEGENTSIEGGTNTHGNLRPELIWLSPVRRRRGAGSRWRTNSSDVLERAPRSERTTVFEIRCSIETKDAVLEVKKRPGEERPDHDGVEGRANE